MNQRQIKILIVDDEIQACHAVSRYLGAAGYAVKMASNGMDAVAIIRDDPQDAILLDIKMPGVDGIETLKMMRRFSEDCVILMLTAVDDLDTALTVLKEKADGFLRKPILLLELRHSVELALDRRRLVSENRSYQKNLEQTVAFQTSELRKMNLYLRKTNMDIVRALSDAIDASDPYTNGHSLRVTAFSMSMGREIGLHADMLETLEYGALLHDIGKIGVMESILSKPGKLTQEEFDHIKRHPVIGDIIISNVDFLKKMRPVVRNHHEKYDGSGYPDGLKSTSIDILARIVSVADTYDAITSDRPYRTAMSRERALAIIMENRGTQFDGELVDVFVGKRMYLL